mmetsp:Transcript_22089/g.48033  ORF Transcript_22089/g.48033 Transcript_22089/m.48033 type:complete len:225 (+) Transcript_22089:84-758(+)
MSDEDHYLDSYLSELLPAIGLDAETYAPYVTGYADDDDDDNGESLDELIELLRASSESHEEDDATWESLRKEITQRRLDHISGESVRKELEALELQATMSANLQKEIALAQKNAVEMEARKQKELEDNKPENMSEEKIALMSKFGYEDGNDNAEAGHDGGDSEKPMTNRDHAAAMSRKEAEKQKSVKTQTKGEAQRETKQAKSDKLAKKEERRKKAGKRERQKM